MPDYCWRMLANREGRSDEFWKGLGLSLLTNESGQKLQR